MEIEVMLLFIAEDGGEPAHRGNAAGAEVVSEGVNRCGRGGVGRGSFGEIDEVGIEIERVGRNAAADALAEDVPEEDGGGRGKKIEIDGAVGGRGEGSAERGCEECQAIEAGAFRGAKGGGEGVGRKENMRGEAIGVMFAGAGTAGDAGGVQLSGEVVAELVRDREAGAGAVGWGAAGVADDGRTAVDVEEKAVDLFLEWSVQDGEAFGAGDDGGIDGAGREMPEGERFGEGAEVHQKSRR